MDATDFPECAALSDSLVYGGWCQKRGKGVQPPTCHDCQSRRTEPGAWFVVEIVSDPFPTATFRAYSVGTRAYVRRCTNNVYNEIFDGRYTKGAQLITPAECRQHLRILGQADERTQARLNEAYRQSLYQ